MMNSNTSWGSPRRDTATRRELGDAGGLKVGDLVRNRVVRLPAWFTVEQARKVVTLRGLDYVLVEEHGQVWGVADRSSLWRANPGDQLARCVSRSEISLSADAPVDQARALMVSRGIECLPVVKSGILIGTVSLADIDFNLEGAAALTA